MNIPGSSSSSDASKPTEGSGCCGKPSGCTTVSLCVLKAGQTGVIADAQLGTEDASLLSAMGLAPGSTVVMCRPGEPCIVAVTSGNRAGPSAGGQGCSAACRIGLAKPLAERIMVNVPSNA